MIVTLGRTWVNLFSDPSQFLVFDRTSGGRKRQRGGRMGSYANGEQRAFVTAAKPGSLDFGLRAADMATVDRLWSWCGQSVIVRDPRGRRDVGRYFEVDETDLAPFHMDVTITLLFETLSEGV